MAEETHPSRDGSAREDVQPYRIRISSRYLDLTRQKLELARLPHEPSSQDWWEPKPQVEALLDFWQENYSWQDHEEELNKSLPQFRTTFQTGTPPTAVRIHFTHAQSPHANAVPLLLIPPFPLTSLSLGHLIQPLTDPVDAGTTQPFHVVIPSLPGLAFSDALPPNAPPISTTAGLFDQLMKRLNYPLYIASNAGSASASPAGIDWRLAKLLSNHYSSSCLGFHFISPQLSAPKFGTSASEWAKWTVARLLSSPMLGYSKDDFTAMQSHGAETSKRGARFDIEMGMNQDVEPNTAAYALCDSPTGLLLYILKMLRTLSPKKELTPKDIITLTSLIWLPGPEAALRFWAQCASKTEPIETRSPSTKPKVTITVFLGDNDQANEPKTLPRPAKSTYVCPSWANPEYNVLHSRRISGKPGYLASDRPEVIFDGVRDLAKAILVKDKRMQASEEPGAVLRDQLEVQDGNIAQADLSGTTVQVSSPGAEPQPDPKTTTDGNQLLAPPPTGGTRHS